MEELGIGEVARRTGIPPSTLRFYERSGVLPRAPRVNGRRRYARELVEIIRVAQFAQGVGFRLAEIRDLVAALHADADPAARWRSLARAKVAELDTVIGKACGMKAAIEAGLACGCIRADDCPRPYPSKTGGR